MSRVAARGVEVELHALEREVARLRAWLRVVETAATLETARQAARLALAGERQ